VNSIAAFAGEIDLSFGKTAEDATFKLVLDLIDAEISIPHKISPNAHPTDMFDLSLRKHCPKEDNSAHRSIIRDIYNPT
jgi:hypothetical protein